jgi:chromosome segregation protein
VHIKRLRLTGFKSFVEPTELIVEAGLTGVVGPNGCGKSNLLEALRWVMGETSHKSMRAAAMDDVIFSGTQTRPARNFAEVAILIDNSERKAPPELNDSDIIEVSRRIERESGSSYRVNGREVRARDIKLLFEDAATGARSPALVRQGQIAEIVNAKPEQRRRILEDAAGVAGLHSRRHEAELRLKAAETNMTRAADVIGGLASQIGSLKRQARAARRYREISDEIRQAESIQLVLTWLRAEADVESGEAALAEALRLLAETTGAEARATACDAEAAERLPGLRQVEAEKAAVLQRLNSEAQSLEREEARVRTRLAELEQRQAEIERDQEREQAIVRDARSHTGDLDQERERLTAAMQAAEQEIAQAHRDAGDRRAASAAADDRLAALTREMATLAANRQRLGSQLAEERRRLDEITARHTRTQAEAAALIDDAHLAAIEVSRSKAEAEAAAVARLELATEVAEEAATRAAHAEAEARGELSRSQIELGRLTAEAETLKRLFVPVSGHSEPIADRLSVEAGFETALGAVLGDDLDHPIDNGAAAHWGKVAIAADDPVLPVGASPLAAVIAAPPELARRLAQTGLVDRADGPRLQQLLKPGQRLVSRDGDVWRWDGLTAAAEAPTAAAARLANRNRLTEIALVLTEAGGRLASANQALAIASAAAKDAREAAHRQKVGLKAAREALSRTRDELARMERKAAEVESRRAALEATIARDEAGIEETRSRVQAYDEEFRSLPDPTPLAASHEEASAATRDLRRLLVEAEAKATNLDREMRQREERLKQIGLDLARWSSRIEASETHLTGLAQRLEDARSEIGALATEPGRLTQARARLADAILAAESGRREAADALALAETAARDLARALKEASEAVALQREARARVETHLEQAREARLQASARLREALDCAPEQALERAGLTDGATLPDLSETERRLTKLRQDRDGLGGVNLRAEEELAELERQHDMLERERADLEAAIDQLRQGIAKLNREGKKRLDEAFAIVSGHFQRLFTTLFAGGEARLEMIEGEDPLEGGLEIFAKPPGKKPATLSLLSGGEQTLTALSLIFAVFLSNPSPICVLDEVDAPLDDANVDRFCTMMEEMGRTTQTRFLVITHHPMTMSRMERLFGVTMAEKGVSQLVSVDLATAESYREAG